MGPGPPYPIRCTILAYTIFVRNITLSASERDIEAARTRARVERTTLNEQFRLWLASYAQQGLATQRYDEVMAELGGWLTVGRRLNREERNER